MNDYGTKVKNSESIFLVDLGDLKITYLNTLFKHNGFQRYKTR